MANLVQILLLFFGIVSAAEPKLLAYWSLNEGTGKRISDKSGNKNDLMISGKGKWVAGIKGFGLLFDGKTVLKPEKDFQNMTVLGDGFTIEIWCMSLIDDFSSESAPETQTLLKAGVNLGGWPSIAIFAGGRGHGVRDRFGFWANAPHWRIYGGKVSSYLWNYVVVEYGNKEMRIYVNGELLSTKKIPIAPIQTDSEAIRGGLNSSVWRVDWRKEWLIGLNFHGIIDEIKVWSGLLGSERIRENFNLMKEKREGKIIDGFGLSTFDSLLKSSAAIYDLNYSKQILSYYFSFSLPEGLKLVKIPLLPFDKKIKSIEPKNIKWEYSEEDNSIYIFHKFDRKPLRIKIYLLTTERENELPKTFYRLDKIPVLPSFIKPETKFKLKTILKGAKLNLAYKTKYTKKGNVIFKAEKVGMKKMKDEFFIKLNELTPGDFIEYKITLLFQKCEYFIPGSFPVVRDPWQESYGVGILGGSWLGTGKITIEEYKERIIKWLNISHLCSISPISKPDKNFLDWMENEGITFSLFPVPDGHWWGIYGSVHSAKKWVAENPESWIINCEGKKLTGGGGYQAAQKDFPNINPTHPAVSLYLKKKLEEKLVDYINYSTFFGIVGDGEWGLNWNMSFWTWEHLGKQFGDYSSWFIEEFMKSTGIEVKGRNPKERAKWIRQNCWGKYRHWCQERVRDNFVKTFLEPARKFRPDIFGGLQPNLDYWGGMIWSPWHRYRATISCNYPLWPRKLYRRGQDIETIRRGEERNFKHYYGHYIGKLPIIEAGLTTGALDAGPVEPQEYKEWFIRTLRFNPHYINLWMTPKTTAGEDIAKMAKGAIRRKGYKLDEIKDVNPLDILLDDEEAEFTRKMAAKMKKLPYIWTIHPEKDQKLHLTTTTLPGISLITKNKLVYLLVTKDPGSMYYVWVMNSSVDVAEVFLKFDPSVLSYKGEEFIKFAKYNRSVKKDWYSINYNENNWKNTELPHQFIDKCYYRVRFDKPFFSGKFGKVYISLENFGCRGWFWLNNKYLAEPITGNDRLYEITDLVEKDKNLLAIKGVGYLSAANLNQIKLIWKNSCERYVVIDALNGKWIGVYDSPIKLKVKVSPLDFKVYKFGPPIEALSLPNYFRDLNKWKGRWSINWKGKRLEVMISSERPFYLKAYFEKSPPQIIIDGKKGKTERKKNEIIARIPKGKHILKIKYKI